MNATEMLQKEIERCEDLEIADGFGSTVLKMNIDVARIAIDSGNTLGMIDACRKLQTYTGDKE